MQGKSCAVFAFQTFGGFRGWSVGFRGERVRDLQSALEPREVSAVAVQG